MPRPRLLDTFCGAGGCSMGYHRTGFDVVGVDHKPQKNYPFSFILGDVFDVLARLIAGEAILASDGKWYTLDDFVAVSASPPCQRYSEGTPMKYKMNHPDLIEITRAVLIDSRKPYVIENVAGARGMLYRTVMLCGTMFGLSVWRHRYFEIVPFFFMSPATCQHTARPVVVNPGSNARRNRGDQRRRHHVEDYREAMGIDWMTGAELSQAIPPAYTEWLGRQLLEVLGYA